MTTLTRRGRPFAGSEARYAGAQKLAEEAIALLRVVNTRRRHQPWEGTRIHVGGIRKRSQFNWLEATLLASYQQELDNTSDWVAQRRLRTAINILEAK